jgi:hypothetical protein
MFPWQTSLYKPENRDRLLSNATRVQRLRKALSYTSRRLGPDGVYSARNASTGSTADARPDGK